jgi:stearoyl-CoA desaturase (delta-9 desaturase)
MSIAAVPPAQRSAPYDGTTSFPDSGTPVTTVASRVRVGVTTAFVVVPFAGLAAAVWLAWGHGLGLADVLLAAGFYALTGLGVTVGFHRLLTHRAFTASRPLRIALAIAGSMTFQGDVIGWVAIHRRHHAFTDRPGDPHSPYRYGTSVSATAFPALCAASLLLPAAAGWLIGGWRTALGAFLWAGLARVALLQHVTWSVNSLCHVIGSRPYATRRYDRATNLWPLALISFGESWHNGHHSDPTCARHGTGRHQVDLSAAVIRFFERLGWVTAVHWPDPARLAARCRSGGG